MEKFSWTDLVKNEEVLHSVKEETSSYMQDEEGRLTGLVTFSVGTAF
jgi:hypothetical protein